MPDHRKTTRSPKRVLRNTTKKVRFRLDVYDKSRQQYRPFAGKCIIIPLETTKLHNPLWRAFTAWLQTGAWEKEIRPEERGADAE